MGYKITAWLLLVKTLNRIQSICSIEHPKFAFLLMKIPKQFDKFSFSNLYPKEFVGPWLEKYNYCPLSCRYKFPPCDHDLSVIYFTSDANFVSEIDHQIFLKIPQPTSVYFFFAMCRDIDEMLLEDLYTRSLSRKVVWMKFYTIRRQQFKGYRMLKKRLRFPSFMMTFSKYKKRMLQHVIINKCLFQYKMKKWIRTSTCCH